MIYGLGTDIVDVTRFEQKVTNNPALITHIFSESEIAYCTQQHKPYLSYAARFAVKEAFLKAFGVDFIGNHALPEIAVLNEKNGKPYIQLSGRTLDTFNELGLNNIHVSISHTNQFAVASIILEK